MVYIKFTKHQLNTLQKLPTNLNTSTTSHNIGGILILSKSQEIKQIVLDFQAYHMDELFTSKNMLSLLFTIKRDILLVGRFGTKIDSDPSFGVASSKIISKFSPPSMDRIISTL